MPLPFNKKLDLKLLDLVKENSILYNTKHEKYLDFDAREVVWQKIGDALGRPASEFAGIQCQIHFGDFQEDKHKPGFIENLNEYLPDTYANSWGVEKKVLRAYRKHQGQGPLEAKNLYIKTARDLPTYGVTFFLVKEKQKGKKKLVPRLLGINAEAILRLDENSKEILQQWPLTHVKSYNVGKAETFTLNFGDYSDKEYSCKTQDAYRIRDILEGYIDIIRRRMLARPCADAGDSMAICHEMVTTGQGQVIQHITDLPSKLVREECIGPSRIVPFEQGSAAQQGTLVMTMQDMIQTNLMNNPQNATKGEVAVRGDMSMDCVSKLKRMNSNSVKIVTLLTDPTEARVKDSQKIVANMQEDLVVVEMGVKATAQQQTVEESKKMLLDEMQDLANFMNKLSDATRPGHVDTSEAKDAAEKIADLTTEMYFSQDPKTKRRSELLNRSKKSFIAGEQMDATLRRASFLAAAGSALGGVQRAKQILDSGTEHTLDAAEARQLTSELQDRMGKLNAALALYLTAHSDPNNIDYAAAITSMDDIKKLTEEVAEDIQKLSGTQQPGPRASLLRDGHALLAGVDILCALTGAGDHEKIQEASNNYADVANKLIFTFSQGRNVPKENEIIELAKDAGAKASQLLMTANELTGLAPAEPAARDVDRAGVRSAGAARDLLACAQLTAPAIHEPHCQSALTAAAEGLSSSVHRLSTTWKPLLEDPGRHQLAEDLLQREKDVHKALERLKDAYANLSADGEDESVPLEERLRLKFIRSLAGAKNTLQDVQYAWDKPGAGSGDKKKDAGWGVVQELKEKEARKRLAEQMAQLNAAIAALAAATTDRENPDYVTAELALNTISELMPQIVKDTEVVSSGQDEATRSAMQQHVAALCDATKQMFADVDRLDGLGEPATKYSAVCRKMVFLISPGADKGKEKMVGQLATAAYDDTAALLSQAHRLKSVQSGQQSARLERAGARADGAARALLTVAQVTAPSLDEARCSSALASSVEHLRGCAGELKTVCDPHLNPDTPQHEEMRDTHQQLENTLDKLLQMCPMEEQAGEGVALSPEQEKKRLHFIKSMSDAKRRLHDAEKQMKEPLACSMMREEDAAALQRQLSERLAQLNATIAALARATADRGNPDYEAAQRAVDTITELMPQVVQGACVLGSTKDEEAQRSLLEHAQELCEASRAICNNAGHPQDLNEAAANFSAASGKLVHLVSPAPDHGKQKQIIDLSAATCVHASSLLSRAQALTQQAPREAGADLDRRGARAADAAQALLTAAQTTATTIASPQCAAELVSATEHLRESAAELTAACRPHMRPGQEQLQLLDSQQQLENSLDKLVQACQDAQTASAPDGLSREQRDKQRLQFVNSLSGAKSSFDDAQHQLKQPVSSTHLEQSVTAALQRQLSDKLAQLNAAIAALTVATADREHPDYASAQRAVSTITALMPQLVQDAQTLSSTKEGPAQQSMLQQVQQLCDASRDICDNAGQPQGLSEAAAKFADASGQLMYTVSPTADNLKEKQIIDLSSESCVRASELLSHVQALTQQVPGDVASDLDARGASTADAAQALLAVAQVTAASISSPHCQSSLESAVETLRGSAADLTATCSPHVKPGAQKQQLQESHKQLADSLDTLLRACREAQSDVPSAKLPREHREKQRLHFVNSLSGAKRCFDDAQHQLKQPVLRSVMSEAEAAALQRQLSDRLAQVNAAVAALAVATADREHPDYASAQRAVSTITALMPQLVQEAKKFSATKDGPAQQSMLQQVQQLCDASRDICDNAGQPQGLSEAAAKFADASGQLMYTVSPTADNLKEKQIIDLSSASCVSASELLSHVQALTQQLPGDVAADLDSRGAGTADAAQGLLAVAQVTAASISSPHCQSSLESAVETLRGSAAELTAACSSHVKPGAQQQQLQGSHKQLEDDLNKLLQASREALSDAPSAKLPREQREKQRLHFVNSLSGAKRCFDDAQHQLKQPVSGTHLEQSVAAALQRQLSDRLAQLNAAVAALTVATADREHPDYASAQRAVSTITALMPQLVQEAKTLSATKDGPAQQSMLQQVQQLCDASRDICDNAGQPQGLSEAAAKFADASGQLMYTVSPTADNLKEKQIIDLSSASCVSASELLSHVQALTQQLPGDVAADLDSRGAGTADAAQGLLAVAQITAASISSPHCQSSLESAVETLRGSAAELTAACSPHVKQGAHQHQLQGSHKQLEDDLNKLLQASREALSDVPSAKLPREQREKQRLHFVNSLSGAKRCFDDAQHLLKQPVSSTHLEQSVTAALLRQLSDKLAQLNAAIAALTVATADREHPDYASAQRAVSTITALMPQLVQEAKTLSATKDGPAQQSMLQQVQQLCDASRDICDNAGQPQDLSEAAAKFADASGQLMYTVSPSADNLKEKQILDLSSASCVSASELLSHVQALTQQLPGDVAADLDSRGAGTADAAQGLLAVAQVTAASISSPHCQSSLESAVETLRGSAAELTAACSSHVKRGAQQQQLQGSHKQLEDDLNKLLQASREAQSDVPSAKLPQEQREKQRLHFVNSLSGAKRCFDDAQHQLKQLVPRFSMSEAEAAALQRQLSERLAQLNATIAALARATADREHPDYASAQRAVSTITVLMPQLVQDAKTLSATKDGPAQQSVLQQVQQLCDASRDICDNAGQQQGLNEAAAKFAGASGKLMFTVSPAADNAKEQQIIDLSSASCVSASELLSRVQALTQQLPGDVAADLDSRGAGTADAAQGLLTVAQVTAASIDSPHCQLSMMSAVETLRGSAAELTAACYPYVKPGAQQQQLQGSHKQLEDDLNKLLQACREGQTGSSAISPVQQEKQRVQFIRSVSTASTHLDDAEKQLKEPLVCSATKQPDTSVLRRQLGRRLALLNVSVAALTSATTDYKYPDYPTAERSIITITELMPRVVQESKALSCSKDDESQRLIQQNLNELYDSSRRICNNADNPRKLNEAAMKFADASCQLVNLVGTEDELTATHATGVKGKGPAVPQRAGQKPAVPVRSQKTVAHAVPARNSCSTQDFLDTLRSEESVDNAARVVAAEAKCVLLARAGESCGHSQFVQDVDCAQDELKRAQDSLKVLCDARHISTPGVGAAEIARKEQRVEDTLARAGVELAALVAANYADKLDYKAALEPTIALTESVKSVVDDGSVISSTLPDNARKAFLNELSGLCDATSQIFDAARNNNEKLNNAAVSFGNQSAKLLQVVCADVNPTLEKEVICRAKAIGDSAARLAQEVNIVANVADSAAAGQRRVQDMCSAGAQCVDAAGKLVYTAKLVAPTMHHSTCQDALLSSAGTLSSNLTAFSNTWKPLVSDPHTAKLTEETKNLETLLEHLKTGVKSGKLGKRIEVDRLVMLDTPLRQMTVQIIENAKNMAEHGELPADVKQEYIKYSSRLEEALRALDLANARCQRAPHDKHRRNELEIAGQDLQMMLLQTRPTRAGQEQNNIVDFRDFLQGLATESEHLTKTADKNQAATGKRVVDDIKLVCSKISEDAVKLMNPTHHVGNDSFDDIMEIYEFGQDCDLLTKELNSTIQSIPDQKARTALQAKLLPLSENCNLLRFATNSALSTAKSAAFEAALQDLDDFDNTVIKALVHQLQEKKKGHVAPVHSAAMSNRAQMSLLEATSGVAVGEPQAIRRALTSYTMEAASAADDEGDGSIISDLEKTVDKVKIYTQFSSLRAANWERPDGHERATTILEDINRTKRLYKKKPKIEVLKEEDINKLLLCQRHKVVGTQNQLEEKFQQLSTKLSSMSGSIFLSVKKPEALSRSLHATADAAAQLADIARGLKDDKKPAQCKKVEDASHEMCLATYSLLKTSELLAQNPNHHDTRRKLLDACRHLNDAINKLNRAIQPSAQISRECGSMLRALQLQRSVLQSAPQPAAAGPYAHCIDALHSQRDVLQKLNNDQAMSREEFLKSMLFITTAVGNSIECAAQATYLLAVAEKDKDVALVGVVDVPKMHKSIACIHDLCVSVVMDPTEQVHETKKILEKQVDDLLKELDESVEKTKDEDMKKMLKKCRKDVNFAAKALYNVINEGKLADVITSLALSLADDARRASAALEHPALVPAAAELSPATQALCDDVVKQSTALVSHTQELIKEIKLTPEQTEVMQWTSYSKRREVLAAFEALLKSIKSNGQDANILEAEAEDSAQNKSYVRIQTETAFKWLHKPMAKSDVKANGQQAVRNLIDIGKKMSDELSGADKEDMRHLVDETEQLLTHCCKKYDQEQYSLLMERIRELQKAIERMAVTRVVEDFMDAEEPLADLDILADAERDETARKFLLERKIAELLAQLGRVTRTARFVADTGSAGARVCSDLKTCSEQTELLAPMLVKAAEQRIHKPDDQVAIDNYTTLLAKYTESLSKVRDLCDRSVDPMDFVQTAGETMQRMREDSSRGDDPMKCAHTSTAITKLANRVIHVGLSSSTARGDPELQRALTEAQQQLSAATPAPDTRASKMPDWRDTTAKILRATEEVESVLGGENIFRKQPDTNQPIYNEALNLHVAIRDWSSRDNEIVAVAKRMAVLMAKLSEYMNTDKQREVLTTSQSIVAESREVARLANKLAHECSDHRIKTNLLQVCERIPTISGQLKMLTTVKGSSLGHYGSQGDKEAMDMLVGNAQSLMISIQDVVKAAASASVKIMSQRGPKIKWVRKTYY